MTPRLDSEELATGSKDGRGCADHDQLFSFGRRPRESAPFPFTTRQYARLLALRSRIANGIFGADDLDANGLERRSVDTPQPQATPSSPTLIYPCGVCGAVVAGAFQSSTFTACPKCALDGGRDQTARAILLTAGVLA